VGHGVEEEEEEKKKERKKAGRGDPEHKVSKKII
jgi:hypothetical protein